MRVRINWPSAEVFKSNVIYRPRVRKSRYWGEKLQSPIHRCDVTKPPYLLSGELCTSPLHSNRLYVYTVCCRRCGQWFSVLRTRHTHVVGDSSGRSYVTEQGHNVPLLRTRDIGYTCNQSVRIWIFVFQHLKHFNLHFSCNLDPQEYIFFFRKSTISKVWRFLSPEKLIFPKIW